MNQTLAWNLIVCLIRPGIVYIVYSFNVDPAILKLFFYLFFIYFNFYLLLRMFRRILSIVGFIILTLSKENHCRELWILAPIICDQVRTLSLFNEQQIWHKVQPILRDPEHALYGEFQHLPHGHQFRSLAHKTNGRGNSFSPLQFHSSRHNQPSELSVVTILYGFYQGSCL